VTAATPTPSASATATPSPSATPSFTSGGVDLAQWVATCGAANPGTPGTAAWNEYWQHTPQASNLAFPIDQMNYPCGPDWVIIPGSDPITPPVWIGKDAPFTPPTNMVGGQIFIAADASAAQLASELGAAGVPVATSGQLLTYGGDGVPVYAPNWWTLSPGVKDAAAAVMFKHDSVPHPMWRTDSYHWGYGNVGVGLPA
jgi:hypothetical protein